jgi:hypothetical protein
MKDACGDGVVVMMREEMAPLRRYGVGDNISGLMVAALRAGRGACRLPAANAAHRRAYRA